MTTTIEKICRTCKFPFSFPTAEATFPCPACGAVNGRPQAEGMSYDCLKRATRQRLACDFHNAEVSYQHVLLEYEEEHEALWGLALCRYGVEYVQDTKTGKLMPTVHSIRKKPMQADSDFLAACEYAPEELRARYEAEAAYIDDAMTGVRKLAETQQPYDVFICHKKTVPGSENLTPEYGKAAEMAHHLEKQGYRVFFAPEAIKSELGADYEAAIYHALDTAKVMLMFCSNVEYVTSAWVRSEWTRFLEMTDEREDKRLVPLLYGDFTPAKLPRELRPYRLECVTMDSFTAASDILRLLEKRCGKRGVEEEKAETVEEKPAPVQPEPEKPAPMPENPVTEMKNAPVQSVPAYAPETDFVTEAVPGGCAITKYKGKGSQVTIPPTIGGQKVVEIGTEAFKECRSLTSITLPEGVTSIGNWAFINCVSLANITLPESLTSIGAWAFNSSVSLATITLPESLTSIGDYAFRNCSTLTSISLPGNLTRMGVNPFCDCSKLVDISVSQSNPVLQGVDGVLFDSNEHRLICYPCTRPGTRYEVPADVSSIGTSAFNHCNALTHITLPEGLTRIGYMAFEGCSALVGVSMPESLTSIGGSAFNTCRKLTSISLPVGLKDIGELAFAHCSGLTRVSLPENVTQGRNVFLGCTSLRADNIIRRSASAESATEKQPASATGPAYAPESDFETAPVAGGCRITKYKGQGGHVNVPLMIGGQKVVEIGTEAFKECRSLTSITLPEGVTSIGYWAFGWCKYLTSIALPESVRSIGEDAFIFCGSLTSITLPESVMSIGNSAFDSCSGLRSIALPDSVTSIGDRAFQHCSSLTSIKLPKGVTSIGDAAFFDCSSLTSITLPKGVTSIGDYSFQDCSSLTSIELPECMSSIGSAAFWSCSSLTSITLPKSLRYIGTEAFYGCDSLPLSLKLKLKLKGAI